MYDVIAGVDGGEVVCVEGVEQGAQQAALSLRSVEVWEPTHTLWRRSDGKTLIQMQVLSGSPWSDSLNTSLSGSTVINAELKSPKRTLT